MKFKARVTPSGNATGVEIPKDVVEDLGAKTPETRQRRIAKLVASMSERSRA